MCFQIVDDVLDLTASEDALGKPAGQGPPRRRLHAPRDLHAARVTGLCDLLGQPIDQEQLAEVRGIATRNGAVEGALDVAPDHAVKRATPSTAPKASTPR